MSMNSLAAETDPGAYTSMSSTPYTSDASQSSISRQCAWWQRGPAVILYGRPK